MITSFDFSRKAWHLLEHEYTSPETLGAGEFAAFTEQILRAIIASPIGKNAPDGQLQPEELRKWLPGAIEEFASKYKDVTYLIICDSILTPEKGEPSVEVAYHEAKATPEGYAQIFEIATFFLLSAPSSSIAAQLSPTNGKMLFPKAADAQRGTMSRRNTKSGSLSRPSRARATSKTTRKRTMLPVE